MYNIEKVIIGLEELIGPDDTAFPYGAADYIEATHGSARKLLKDALAMLKAQEPVEPKKDDDKE